MGKKWTIEEANAYVTKVLKGKQSAGLTYCSALDFLRNHTNIEINLHPLATKEQDNDSTNSLE